MFHKINKLAHFNSLTYKLLPGTNKYKYMDMVLLRYHLKQMTRIFSPSDVVYKPTGDINYSQENSQQS